MSSRTRTHLLFLAVVAFVLLAPVPAHASAGGPQMPWDTPLQTVVDNLTGTVAKLVVLAMTAVAGIMWMVSEHGQGVKKMSQLIFGGGLALFSVQFLAALGFNSATLF